MFLLQLAAECYLLVRSVKLLNLENGCHDDDKSTGKNGTDRTAPLDKSDNKQTDEPTTSTPVKSGIDFSDGDLIGTVLELPEANNPYKLMMENYSRLIEYFGDSLSMKLPHHHVREYYCQRKREMEVKLGDENTSKSGEELLQQLLLTDDVAGSESGFINVVNADDLVVVDEDGKSDSHSLDPGTYEMDYEGAYDGDEKSIKSERSERSSRSSRSERSHSDETFNSFTDADTDLTVKAVSESTGIKLFITKRPKAKVAGDIDSPVQEGTKVDEMPILQVTAPKKVTKRYAITEVFEQVPLNQPPPVVFVFRFQSREQMFLRDLSRVKLPKPIYQPVQSLDLWKTHGRIPRPNRFKKMLQMHHYSCTLEAPL